MKRSKDLVVFLHLHKCAGSTIRHHIIKSLNESEYILLRKRTNPDWGNYEMIEKYLQELGPADKDNISFIQGHGAFWGIHKYFGKESKYITFVRNPYSRAISNYNFFIENIGDGHRSRLSILRKDGSIKDFVEWLNTTPRMMNYMTRFLYERLIKRKYDGTITQEILGQVKEMLKNFYFVGLTENLDDQLFVYGLFNVEKFFEDRNVTNKIYIPTDSDRAEFESLNIIDYELYKYISELRSLKIKEIPYMAQVEKMKEKRFAAPLLKNEYN